MDLFLTDGALEIVMTIVLAALFGFKNFEFYWIWFGAIALASFLIGFGWKLSDFWSLPSGGQAAFLVLATINFAFAWVSYVLAGGKASERLRRT